MLTVLLVLGVAGSLVEHAPVAIDTIAEVEVIEDDPESVAIPTERPTIADRDLRPTETATVEHLARTLAHPPPLPPPIR
jgi:hypothetical protein